MSREDKFPPFIHLIRNNAEGRLVIASTTTAEAAIDTKYMARVATYKLQEIKEGKLEPIFSVTVVE